jgi:hypothetical protein
MERVQVNWDISQIEVNVGGKYTRNRINDKIPADSSRFQPPCSCFFFRKKLYLNRLPDDVAHVSHFGKQATHGLKLDSMHKVNDVLLNLFLIKRPVCPMQT